MKKIQIHLRSKKIPPFFFGLYFLEEHLSSDFLRILEEPFSYLELLFSLEYFFFYVVEIFWFVSDWLELKVEITNDRKIKN